MKIEVTVVIATYGANYEKLFKTIFSTYIQTDINYEIVIADDGTENFDVKRIMDWFDKVMFKNYQIIHQEENVGTVCNILKAVERAKGKYIKLISPGDYFYNTIVLKKMFDEMEQKKAVVGFGKAAGYTIDNGLKLWEYKAPKVLEPYINEAYTKIKRNYLLYRDYILGASLIYDREVLLKYLNMIAGKIKYAEDATVILMVADGFVPCYIEQYVVWYEVGTGISTNASANWTKRLKQDHIKCFEFISEKYPNESIAYDCIVGKKNISTIKIAVVKRLYYLYMKMVSSKSEHNKNIFMYKYLSEILLQYDENDKIEDYMKRLSDLRIDTI